MEVKIDDFNLGRVLGATAPAAQWTPEAVADLEKNRRRFTFWARWHPLASSRARYRRALAILDGLEQGIRASQFYEQALEYGRRHAVAKK